MSDFSLDDILDKYSHKDGGKSSSEDVDDILNDILGISSSPHKSGEKEQTEDPYIRHSLISSCMIIRYIENYHQREVDLPPVEKSLLRKNT